ncbi:MAG TPA: 30S ribosomal protein S2, partial [Candidatus Marinimicrobia bacterium]|nr:30S ribosomal protein S2 [Candidatus Neomarinimicrobiota bacterium]
NIDFPIPANDDSMKTIGLIVNYIADTIIEATGGTAQMDEAVYTTPDSETSEEEITEESSAEENAGTEPESEPEVAEESAQAEEEVIEEVQEENQE